MKKVQRINRGLYLLMMSLLITVMFGCKDDTTDGPGDNPTFPPVDFERGPNFWWPEQKTAANLIILQTVNGESDFMLAESLSGLAAKAVNNGDNDELVWIETHSPSMDEWAARLKNRLNFISVNTMSTWELIEHFKSKEIIKGYVLYKYDRSEGNMYEPRENIDISCNIATSAAGVLNAIVIDEEQEQQAMSVGLERLFDARNVSYKSLFDTILPAVNPYLITLADPKATNLRGYAIANNIFLFDNHEETNLEYYFSHIESVSPVLGWGFGDEAEFNRVLSSDGLFSTASNWCHNLPVSSAGAQSYQPQKVHSLDPNDIDWDESGYFHSFAMSDGDNMQWMQTSFFHNEEYWANQYHGQFPFAWTICAVNLSQTIPDILDFMAETQPDDVTIIEYGGGYQYPDLFAENRDREAAVRELAKKVNIHMKKTGVKVFGFICQNLDSEASKEAYQIYADEIEDLTGMIAVQYAPYEAGDGRIYWVTNKEGKHIPVVTSKFTIWENLDNDRVGDPWKIAGLINDEADKVHPDEDPKATWTMIHSWSYFEHNGERTRGLTPIKWCIDELSSDVKIISIEEMLWRLRMQYYPDEVQALLTN
jgi:hypothetical protein